MNDSKNRKFDPIRKIVTEFQFTGLLRLYQVPAVGQNGIIVFF